MNNTNSIVNNLLVFLCKSSELIERIGGPVALLTLIFEYIRNTGRRWLKICIVIFVVLFFVPSMIIGFFGTIVPDIVGFSGVTAKQEMGNNDLVWCDPDGLDNRYLKGAIVTKVVPFPGTFVWKSKKIFIKHNNSFF